MTLYEGDHKVKSQQRLQMSEDCKLNFNKQILEIEATLYFDEKEQVYQEKTVLLKLFQGELSVVLLDQKDTKVLLGDLTFDIAAYANSGQESIKESIKLQNSPKKMEGRIEFNVFVKYIGEGSESSADKVSDFFFGKNKDEAKEGSQKDKEKGKRNESRKKGEKEAEQPKKGKSKQMPQSKSEQSYDIEPTQKQKQKQRQKQKTKGQLKVQQTKSKGQQKVPSKQQSSNRQQSISKNLVVPSSKSNSNNNDKPYLTSDNDQSSHKQFYFDEPYSKGLKDPKDKTRKVNQVKKQDQKLASKQVKGKHKMVDNSQEEGSQGDQDIATSEVERVDVGHMFAKSQAQQVSRNQPLVKSQVTSLKDEPIPVKIRDRTGQKSSVKENSIKPLSKKGDQISKLAIQQDRKDRQNDMKSVDKRKQSKQQQFKKEKDQPKEEKRKEKEQKRKEKEKEKEKVKKPEEQDEEDGFDFGKKMSNDWLEKNDENRKENEQSDEEFDFEQKNYSNTKISTGKGAMMTKTSISNNLKDSKKGKQAEKPLQKQKQQQQLRNPSGNKFKKSIIEELLPQNIDKVKDKQKHNQQCKKKNPFEEQSDEEYQKQDQQGSKYTTSSTNNNKNSKKLQKAQILSGKSNDYQKLVSQNHFLKEKVLQQESTIKNLQRQLNQSHQSLEELQEQVRYYQSELKIKEQELGQHVAHSSKRIENQYEERTSIQKLQLQLRNTEKLKNQIIVENSKLKEKYRKEFAQYQQVLEQKQAQALNTKKSLKAEIVKFKDENSTLRAQVDKLTSQSTVKSQENTKLKSQLYQTEKQTAQVKDALSNLKLKICALLNEALSNGESGAIELLMELNKH